MQFYFKHISGDETLECQHSDESYLNWNDFKDAATACLKYYFK